MNDKQACPPHALMFIIPQTGVFLPKKGRREYVFNLWAVTRLLGAFYLVMVYDI